MSRSTWRQDEARGDAREDAARSTAPDLVRCELCEDVVLRGELDEDELCGACSIWVSTLTDSLADDVVEAS